MYTSNSISFSLKYMYTTDICLYMYENHMYFMMYILCCLSWEMNSVWIESTYLARASTGQWKSTWRNKMSLFPKNVESNWSERQISRILSESPGRARPELQRSFCRSPGQEATHLHSFPEEPCEFREVIMQNTTGILCNELVKTYYVLNGHFTAI